MEKQDLSECPLSPKILEYLQKSPEASGIGIYDVRQRLPAQIEYGASCFEFQNPGKFPSGFSR
jgi:hypothetical protein